MRLLSSLLILVLTATVPLPAGAQAAKPAPLPTPKKLTLAQALAALPPPDNGLRVSVSAEQVVLPDNAEPPPADASLEEVAGAFGDQAVSFGSVTAIAPQTMTLLNTQPGSPNLAADVPVVVALKMLAASLDDAQWKMLTSEHGLGLDDLTDGTQRGLFHALFNHGHLWIASADPALRDVPEGQKTDIRDVSDEIDATRIRLGQTADIDLFDRKGKILFFGGDRPDDAQRLRTYHPKNLPAPSAEHGVTLRVSVPNQLKPSDLAYDSKILQQPVLTAGLTTVGSLISRIGHTAGVELYADPHYAARTLTLSSTAATEPAGDLLRALCLCVTGTFRKVGPAFVLTDDLAGVGARRHRLQQWEDSAMTATNDAENQSGTVMLEHHGAEARHLPTFGDSLAVTPEEMAALKDMPGLPGVPPDIGNDYPFAKLTPAQQDWARQTAASYDEQLHSDTLPFYLKGDDLDEADLTHNVNLGVNYQVQFLIPSVGAPVDTTLQSPLWLLFFRGDTPEAEKDYNALYAQELAKLPPAPPLSAALRLGRVRAVEAHTRTAKDIDALIAAMQKLGLNTLILDVFSGGGNHVKTSAASGTDILTEALARTRGTGIRVYAQMSLLTWGDAPPQSVQDLTIDGQNNRQAALAKEEASPSEKIGDDGTSLPFTPPSIRVSPASPVVYESLAAQVQDLAARPGLAGFVWEDAAPDNDLGYTLAMRLAFLRDAHADPLDVVSFLHYLRVDDSLPLFDDKDIDASLADRWTKVRTQADAALLGRLYAAVPSSAGPLLPILMERWQYDYLGWLTSWDNPNFMPPPLRDLSQGAPHPAPETIMRLARSQGRIVVRCETVASDGETPALARKLNDDLKAMPSDGFVLEFRHDGITQGAAPLESLVEAIAAESRPGSKTAGETKSKGKAVN